MEQNKTAEKTLGVLTWTAKMVVGVIMLIGIALISTIINMIYQSSTKPIEINKQIVYLLPAMQEIELGLVEGKINKEQEVKTLLEKKEDGTIVASEYKNGLLYLNLMTERGNYYVDDKIVIMKPVVNDNKVNWQCFYVQAGTVVGDDPYSCIKTSGTMQRKKNLSEKYKVEMPKGLFNDREVLLKLYTQNGKEAPAGLLAAIEDEKKLKAKYAKKSEAKEKEKQSS